MSRVGGPTDSRAQGYMLRFPRPDDQPSDLITLRGPRPIVERLQEEILKDISSVRDRVVYGVLVPKSSHAAIIGRSGANVNELSAKHGVKVVFPNWKDAAVSEEPVNANELGSDYDPQDLIRLVGLLSACQAAEKALKASKPTSNGSGQSRPASSNAGRIVKTVDIPVRLHRNIANGGRFFRNLPPGTNISHGTHTPPATGPSRPKPFANGGGRAAPTARIDQDEEDHPAEEFGFEVIQLLDEEDDGETIPWIISSASETATEKTEELLRTALANAQASTHLGYLQVPTSMMPRIVGRGGSGLERLKAESGASVEVIGRQNADTGTHVYTMLRNSTNTHTFCTVCFTGSLQQIEAAKALVEKLANDNRRA